MGPIIIIYFNGSYGCGSSFKYKIMWIKICKHIIRSMAIGFVYHIPFTTESGKCLNEPHLSEDETHVTNVY